MTSGQKVCASHFDGTRWSPEERLDGVLSHDGLGPSICLDRTGLPVVAWLGGPVGTGAVGIFTNRYGLTAIDEEGPSIVPAQSPSLRVRSPTAGAVRIEYCVPASGTHEISIFDASGRLVRTFGLQRSTQGTFLQTWYGRNSVGRRVSSGSYVCRLQTAGEAAVAKIVLLGKE
jgi:hypothetical protein